MTTPHDRIPRRACKGSAWIRRGALLLAGLWIVAWGAACAGGRTVPPDPAAREDIDYRARHERMLEVVIERPHVMEQQRLERERRARRDDRTAWEAVAQRQRAYEASQQQRRQKSDAFYLELLERQQKHSAAREQVRTERWARFMEANPPSLLEQAGGEGAPPQ